jgi:hypothetical protein
MLVCDEVGTVYPHPDDLAIGPYGDIADASYMCPHCGEAAASDFKNSTGDEVQHFGFRVGEYV